VEHNILRDYLFINQFNCGRGSKMISPDHCKEARLCSCVWRIYRVRQKS